MSITVIKFYNKCIVVKVLHSNVIVVYYHSMFTETCRRLRIMKGSEAIGLGMYHSLMYKVTYL